MEDDEISYIDVAPDSAPTSYERQLKTLHTYLDSLPYECETVERMHDVLESIVGKMFIAVEAKNWVLFTSWDGMLQCWLAMYYPMPTTTRAKLIRVYYELCVLPGIDPRNIRNWSDTLSRLIGSKYAGLRKVDPADLQLPWQPLWKAVKKELWPKSPSSDSTRNVVNILFFIVDKVKRYFPPEAVPEMLEVFLPEVTQDTLLTMIPVLTSFLPLTNAGLYLPALFKIWEAFNSAIVDDRMLELCGELAEDHVAGLSGEAGQYGAEWKDIGIWTQWQWDLLTGKCLSSTNMPIGLMGSSATSTSSVADSNSKQRVKIKKTTSRLVAMAKIFVYSISQDGEVRDTTADPSKQTGLLAGSKALDTLDKLINSAENYFHPSNNGPWTTSLTAFIQRLCAEFIARWNGQALSSCKVPESQQLTPQIKRAFVALLRTPALLSMFAKDAGAASFAQGALRTLALLEPNMIMPELLERAYGGLEVVNETHRTTGVLSTLSGVTRPLVTESVWVGGQKHLVPLLELCLPGIDLNDPTKTIYATMFIVGAIQHVKIGDLSAHQGGVAFTGDSGEDRMDVDADVDRMPEDLGDETVLNRDEERSLTRDSTSGFADWVVSLFRRVFSLYENLPEEGGKRQVTGGKTEEAVLKSIKNMLDVVCLHLSEPLFDLVLKLVYDYATTNAKSNSVRAFGQLVASLAKVNAEKTVNRFMPYCAAQIEDELKHGASSVRTTSSHAAVPSDTTLHWNLSILRGCLGYGGKTLVKHKDEIIKLMSVLIEKTKSERGYTSTGRLITRVLNTISGIYPLQGRFVNPSVWEDPSFDKSHNLSWGKLMEASDVDIEWHVPSAEEVDFILQIIERVGDRKLNDIEELLSTTSKWDNVARNDFCRYLHAVRSVWIGLPTIFKSQPVARPNNMLMLEFENPAMIVSTLDMNCGFVLTNPDDPRYQRVIAYRERFGQVVKRAATLLRKGSGGEDHTDAVITVTRCIDTYLSSYGLTHGEYEALKKNYTAARELNRSWIRQKDNARLIWIKRAHVYHMSRVHMHSMFRGRQQLDDDLLMELVELSLSQYTRIRRQAQATLITATMRYVRSTRLVLPTLFNALARGNDPDRMKGSLYVLAHKGIAAYTLQDLEHQKTYLLSLLECQHEDKPSIQKLVTQVVNDAGLVLGEENINTHAYHLAIPRVLEALSTLPSEFSALFIDQAVRQDILTKTLRKASKREEIWSETISAILDITARPTTHWRYTQMALQLLCNLLWREVPATPELARFIASQATSPQQVIRTYAHRAMGQLLYHVKIRTYCRTREARWFEEWTSPWKMEIDVNDPAELLAEWQKPIKDSVNKFYIDKLSTGFLAWTKTIKVYRLPQEVPVVQWDQHSHAGLEAIQNVIVDDANYVQQLVSLWSQESGKNSDLQLRMDNVVYMKLLSKVFGDRLLDIVLEAIDPLILDADKFKQRAAGEFILALLRGSKNWLPSSSEKLWSWLKDRIDRIFAQIRPDTLAFWEQVFHSQLASRDPRRNHVLVDWIKSIPKEFSRFSAFDSMKSMSMVGTLLATAQAMPKDEARGYIDRYFKDADTGYAELRQYICNHLYLVMRNQWRPWHKSTEEFLAACTESRDVLRVRQAIYMDHISAIIGQLPQWREERLPPPRVNQSQYDKVGLTVLQWIWVSSYGAPAHLVIPYIVPLLPEILRMSELSDNPDLQAYSSGVLYVLSALTPLSDYVNPILDQFVASIESSTSWRTRLHGLPAVAIFFFRNLLTLSQDQIDRVLSLLLDCLSNENVEVREVASKVLSSVVRTSQRQSIIPLKKRFVTLARKTTVPGRRDPQYATHLRTLHSAILGICALIESFPYSVEPWMPPLTEVLARHASDPPPISTTIRKTASEFKKTHQDTWHKDQHMFDEDQLQSLSTMLVGTSYYA